MKRPWCEDHKTSLSELFDDSFLIRLLLIAFPDGESPAAEICLSFLACVNRDSPVTAL
jgi:hypothetical protein